MNNLFSKTTVIILSILIFLGLITIAIILWGQNSNPTINIQTPNGSIKVSDFTKNPISTTTDAVIIAQTTDYQILNYKIDKSFFITLLSQPLKQARANAEQALVSNLKITQDQACELNISVKTTKDIDPVYSGHELGLSFCPNFVILP